MSTRPCGARATAARKPAMPLPMIRKSAETRAITVACYPTRPGMTIHVTSARGPYQVHIEPGALAKLSSLLRARGLDGRRLIVSTPPVWRRHGRRLARVARRGERPALIPDGERGKTLAVAACLYDACLDRHLDRAS